MEPGESPEECVVREVFEESGLHLRQPILRGVLTWPKFDGIKDWYAFVFTGFEFSGTLKERSSEGDLRWIPLGEIPKLEMWEGDRIFMQWILDGKFFSGKFIYERGSLVDHHAVFYDPGGNPFP